MSSHSNTNKLDNNSSITNLPISYTWKIPSLSSYEKLLLCNAYVQNTCEYIPKPLIQLISDYFTNDSFTLQEMKNCNGSDSFCTQIISIKSIKIYLKIYPNGITDVFNRFSIVVKTPPLPPQIPQICIVYKLIINNKHETHEKKVNGDDTGIYGVSFINDFNISEYNTLNIKLIVSKLLIQDENGDIIKDCLNINNIPISIQPMDYMLPQMNYEWIISCTTILSSIQNAYPDQWFSSPIFEFGKFKMTLTFSPNNHGTEDSVLYIRITSFPDNINKLRLKAYFCIIETNTKYIDDNLSLFPGGELIGWPNGLLHKTQLQKLDRLSFKIEFTIYEIFDKNDRIISNYIEKLSIENNQLIELPIAIYEWKLFDINMIKKIHLCKNVMSLISNILIMGPFKYYLAIYPDGINKKTKGKLCFGLKLLYVPPILSKVSWRFNMHFPEMNVSKTYIASMESKLDIGGSNPWCWLGINIEKNKLKLMNKFTLYLEVTLIDCYDLNNNYINNNNSF
eukprot:394400_1